MTTRARIQIVVSAVATAAVVIHHVWPGFRADAFTGTFLVVAVLPWLAPILKTIKLPGGLEVELRELREDLDETKGAVKSAAIQAQVGAAVIAPPAAGPLQRGEPAAESPDRLRMLGAEYERVRDSMPSGTLRTEAMTRVLAEMFRTASAIRELDIRPLITSASRGDRLAGIAYAHEHASPDLAEPLVAALSGAEDTPYGQYWILRALRRIAAPSAGVFRGHLCGRLVEYRSRQKPGTDRQYEATQLLREAGCRAARADDPSGF